MVVSARASVGGWLEVPAGGAGAAVGGAGAAGAAVGAAAGNAVEMAAPACVATLFGTTAGASAAPQPAKLIIQAMPSPHWRMSDVGEVGMRALLAARLSSKDAASS